MCNRIDATLLALAAAAGLAWGTAAAQAPEAYPAKPVRIIVPFAPGGASDFVARIIGPKLAEALGQQVVIENRAGAAGNVGMELAARAPADGYTLYLGNVGTVAINPSIFGATLKVDPAKDFAPITLAADTPDVLIANPSFPASNVKEFVAYAKANPGKVSFASPGSGSMNRLEMEQFRILAGGLDMVHIPYKAGAGQAVTDVLGGQVPVMFTTLSSAIGHVKSGKLKALAVTTRDRVPQVADVPTLGEQGYDLVASSWQGVLAPAGTPKPVLDKLHATLVKVLAAPDVRERFANGGVRVLTSASPEEFAQFIGAESQRWAQVVKASGASAD